MLTTVHVLFVYPWGASISSNTIPRVCCPLTMFDFGRFKDHGSFQLMGNGPHLCPQIDCSVVTFEPVY